jgi:mRNA-degrading endonuclease toxin of MazEF toxin-antitoxin module
MLRLEISRNKKSTFFLIRSLGFKPLGKQIKQMDPDKEKELAERLKTLGYIE